MSSSLGTAAAIVREARRRAGLSQRALAERAGASPASIARVEAGREQPTVERLERLVEACGLQLVVALGEAGTAYVLTPAP